jgi:hypothetical protein
MRRTALLLSVAALAAVASLLVPTPAEASISWNAFELRPVFPGDPTTVVDINASGSSVGWEIHDSQFLPVRWDAGGNPTALALPGGCTSGNAHGISSTGYIAGIAQCAGGTNQGVLWTTDGMPVKLTTGVNPQAVNDAGITVGDAGASTGGPFGSTAYAFALGVGRFDLPKASALDSWAAELTSWGYVVGTLLELPGANAPDRVAVGWYGGAVFPLLFTAESTVATGVNEAGYTLVQIQDLGSGVREQAYVVRPGGAATPLAHPGFDDRASDINDYGVVIGSTRATEHGAWGGAYYVGGTTVRLDAVAAPAAVATFGFDQPAAINNASWVVGTHGDGNGGVSWLLRPDAGLPTTG